jgi:hypothetical protein
MRRKHFLIVISLLAIFLGSAAAGRRLRTGATHLPAIGAYAQVNVIPNPDSLPAACRASVRVLSTEKVETGSLSETFLVKWSTDLACLSSASVTVTATRQDGSRESKTETVKGVNQALVKVFGFRQGNPTVSAAAAVTAAGEQGTFAEKTINF